MDISKSLADFSLKISRQLVAEAEDRNVAFSSASIFLALAMLGSGSQEETRHELKEFLGVDFSILTTEKGSDKSSDLENSISKVLASIQKTTELNNKIYTKIGLNQDYMNAAQKVFKAVCETIDFVDPDKAIKEINSWVSGKTNGRIKELIQESSITPDTVLLLLNTIYFKADWEIKFDKSETRPAKFFLEDGKQIGIKMMYQEAREDIYEEVDKFLALKKKFINCDMVGVFILPEKGQKLKDFLLNFKIEDLNNCITKSRKMTVDIYIPKCVIKMNKLISETLKKCGLNYTFDRKKCNLKSMSPEELFVSDVCHSAAVTVSEEGVEAAAATSVTISLRCAVMNFEFVLDRPFIFIIYDTKLNIPVFVNAVFDPNQ